MRIDVNHEKKIVSIWLTNAEKNHQAIAHQLNGLYKQYKDQKYLVAVFKSGNGDLSSYTSDLICYNCKKLA